MSTCIYCGKENIRERNNPRDYLHDDVADWRRAGTCVCNSCDRIVTQTNRAISFYITGKWTAEHLSYFLKDLAERIEQGV